jgi:predicted DNA binding CopG/RHH family protein
MTRVKKTIPDFKNRQQEAKFFDTHDMADFQHEFKTVRAKFAKSLSEGITIRFDKPTLEKLREVAQEKGLGPTTLARMWILEHLR